MGKPITISHLTNYHAFSIYGTQTQDLIQTFGNDYKNSYVSSKVN